MYRALFFIIIILNFNVFKLTPFWDIEIYGRFIFAIISIPLFFIRSFLYGSFKKILVVFYLIGSMSLYTGLTLFGQTLTSGFIAALKIWSSANVLLLLPLLQLLLLLWFR